MTKGFVTIATGSMKYFVLARNLLNSYRYFSENPLPFAIITDRQNEYTSEFDDVIILDKVTSSYLDKLNILIYSPYDETIFIDADCLAYKDLNEYWNLFKYSDDFSCFGKSLDTNSTDGWFNINDIGNFSNDINFIPQMHGGICFIRKGEKCRRIYELCIDIANNYDKYKFKYFDKPADEPLLALSMSLYNCRPTSKNSNSYVFYPICKNLKSDIFLGKLSYKDNSGSIISNVMLVHWQNINTEKELYKFEVEKLNIMMRNKKNLSIIEIILYKLKIRYIYLKLNIILIDLIKKIKRRTFKSIFSN